MKTMVTFRTDEKLRDDANVIFNALGMNLSSAINMFLKQTVLKGRFPCSLELDVAKNYEFTYPKGFFEMFGDGKNLGLDEEPEEISFELDKREQI